MKSKIAISGVLLSLLLLAAISIFWHQEWKYSLPTPVPASYQAILPGQKIQLHTWSVSQEGKPVLLHFFNPDCPCSRFNFNNFQKLVSLYKDRVLFCVVLQVDKIDGAMENFKNRYELDVPVFIDTDKKLAEACGVYSTPQAVLLKADNSLYFRGNYNRSRYCTDPQTNFARMALDSLLANRPTPGFSLFATTPYGCQLPDNSSVTNNISF